MPLDIVKAQPADLLEVLRLNGVVQDLHAQLNPDIFRSDWLPLELEDCWRTRLKDQNSTVSIARLDGKAVGYIWFEVQVRGQDALHLSRGRIYVHRLAVEENVRGEGIGAKLLEQAELEAKRRGISKVILDAWASNSRAQAFFSSRGYDPVNIVRGKIVGSDD